MLSTDELISFPITSKTFKTFLREEGIPSNSLRRLWWPIYFSLLSNHELNQFPDISRNVFKKYHIVINQNNNDVNLPIDLSWNEDTNINITYSIMKLLVQLYDIQDPGLIYPLLLQISKVITNKAFCYYILSEIIEQSSRYLKASPSSHRLKLHAFRELTKRCMIHTYQLLQSIGALEEQYLNLIFVDMFTTILPNDYVNSIVNFNFSL